MTDVVRAKEAAGRAAALLVEDGMLLGLGTGSTVRYFLEALGERVRAERLRVRGVPTSEDTAQRARALGIPLEELANVERIDLTVDGADEIDGRFDMIKGGGGALLREKVVARLTRREVVVVDPGKVVARLGSTFDLPIEVVPFAQPVVQRELATLGLVPRVRRASKSADAPPFRTDNGNLVLDCHVPGGISDPGGLERELIAICGVVEVGLFVGLAHTLIVGYPDGATRRLERDA
jgi:ribose 5-phosphate isomerase A